MKVIDDGRQNFFGNQIIIFQHAKVSEIWDWLDKHYHGYKFVIVMDCTKDEHFPIDDVTVEFMGDVASEAIECNDEYRAVNWKEYQEFTKWRREHDKG